MDVFLCRAVAALDDGGGGEDEKADRLFLYGRRDLAQELGRIWTTELKEYIREGEIRKFIWIQFS
jgi:hypothetical protein